MSTTYRVGTRGSALALQQTHEIIRMLQRKDPALQFEIEEIATHGDRFQDTRITDMHAHIDRGIFNSGLEEAIQQGEVDFATCSFKDVESDLPDGIEAVSVGRREDPRDVLVSRHGKPLSALPAGAVLATSSPRRASQLKLFRSDFRFAPLRGNITTRVGQSAEAYDGVIVAAAGLIRLGLQDRISEWIDGEVLLPAAAQAAMGCEYDPARGDVAALIASIQDSDTERCVRAEKKLLVTLSGGCFAPIGVLAQCKGSEIHIRCRIVSLDGGQLVEEEIVGAPEDADGLVAQLAEALSARGGREIIQQTRAELQDS
jgi:hydroxymethylbilane synthase